MLGKRAVTLKRKKIRIDRTKWSVSRIRAFWKNILLEASSEKRILHEQQIKQNMARDIVASKLFRKKQELAKLEIAKAKKLANEFIRGKKHYAKSIRNIKRIKKAIEEGHHMSSIDRERLNKHLKYHKTEAGRIKEALYGDIKNIVI